MGRFRTACSAPPSCTPSKLPGLYQRRSGLRYEHDDIRVSRLLLSVRSWSIWKRECCHSLNEAGVSADVAAVGSFDRECGSLIPERRRGQAGNRTSGGGPLAGSDKWGPLRPPVCCVLMGVNAAGTRPVSRYCRRHLQRYCFARGAAATEVYVLVVAIRLPPS